MFSPNIRLKHRLMADGGRMVSMFMPCAVSFKVLVCSLKIEPFIFFIYKDVFIE